jgi:hypothetical protein
MACCLAAVLGLLGCWSTRTPHASAGHGACRATQRRRGGAALGVALLAAQAAGVAMHTTRSPGPGADLCSAQKAIHAMWN